MPNKSRKRGTRLFFCFPLSYMQQIRCIATNKLSSSDPLHKIYLTEFNHYSTLLTVYILETIKGEDTYLNKEKN